MSFYLKRGTLPRAQHTQLWSDDGKLRYEEHISREASAIDRHQEFTSVKRDPPGSALELRNADFGLRIGQSEP